MQALSRYFYSLASLMMIVGSMILSSCMPETTPRTDTSASTGITAGSGSGNGTGNSSANPAFPLSGIFIQEGPTQTNSNLVLAIDFNDSFLIRGEALSTYLKTIPNTTRFCLVGKYASYTKALIVSAKAQSFTDFSKGTTEFYLQVEPSQLTSNQNDCLTPNLTGVLSSETPGLGINFDLQSVCSTCTSSATSDPLKLYFVNGEAVPNLNFSSLKLTISGGTSTTNPTSCIANSACVARGYTCCLQNQCVTDGAVRSGVDLLSSSFLVAQEDVRNNPNRFTSYPQYYYVCESSTPTDPGNGGDATDPNYEAQVRLMEQTQLYNCLNQVQDEFSYCTVKYPSIKSQIQAGYTFSVKPDDINFSSFMPSGFLNKNNITKIYYAGQTLYEEGATLVTPLNTSVIETITTPNDAIGTSQSIKFFSNTNLTGPDDNLYISFRVNGTCEQLSTGLARCKKTYIQGLTDSSSTFYHPSGNSFAIPSYANVTNYTVTVKLSDISVAQDDKWTLNSGARTINFTQNVQPNQKVEITYYVSGTATVSALTGYRKENQLSVNTMCGCDQVSGKCNLTPKRAADGTTLIGYDCFYPSNSTETPPANQTVYVSSRNMPVRYYDSGGINYDENYSQGEVQEGVEFKYTNNDTLKPNNLDLSTKIGFNEIHGSIIRGSSTSARPAKMVRVKKDQIYDLYTNDGAFSSCTTCGNDYYSALQKIFPQNFYGVGGGYTPDNYVSSRVNSTSIYRSDDLLFGRACFLPATMIPWTHKSPTGVDVKTQRRNRLEAQHFLFANGYQRDWFGFDYGSIIGSFDGVTWFSIGNQRRIKATTNRLYLAVNSYFGDLNVDNSFNITVSESTSAGNNTVTNDTLSSGAECQKSHFCATDNDCIKQVGYEYTCQNVAGIYTEWPMFDSNAQEIIGTSRRTLSNIIGSLSGQNKRCVYRGRGATCHKDLNNTASTYNDSGVTGLLACSSNNYCENVNGISRFNNRIARVANTPVSQNIAYPTNLTDTFALGARILGRPYNFYGTEAANTTVVNQLQQGLASGAICIPGKEISSSNTTYDLLTRQPPTRPESADKNYGIGRILNVTQSPKFYAACPATNTSGNYIQWQNLSLSSTLDGLNERTISQNLSTKHFELTPLINIGIYNANPSGPNFTTLGQPQVTTQGYQRNACLRAPGAACFSDLDCGPSDFIATKFKNATGLDSILNSHEIEYWKEELICGNPDYKYLNSSQTKNPNFDIKKNNCCRDMGKTLTVGTQQIRGLTSSTYSNLSDFAYCDPAIPGTDKRAVAGYNKPITSYSRYSRIHTIYDKMTCENITAGDKLKAPMAQFNTTASDTPLDINFILGQYKTLDTMNSKMCCTTHWVRHFDTSLGGGYTWARNKGQTFNKKIFRALSWRPQDATSYEADGVTLRDAPFECLPGEADFASCEIENFSAAKEKKYLEWFAAFELTGIPQVIIPNHRTIFKTVADDINNDSAVSNQTAPALYTPVDQTIDAVASENEDYVDTSTSEQLLSMASGNKFMTQVKTVFSKDKFNCCIPTGGEVPEGTTASQCCTGNLANIDGPLRCCLPDYTDVTLYLNRYVSSEGRGLTDSAYDLRTGYIKDPAIVLQKAANVCCSGRAAYGVAISELHIPLTGGTVDETAPKTRRFVYRDDAVDNNTVTKSIGSKFEAGLRWNNHVYCIGKNDQGFD